MSRYRICAMGNSHLAAAKLGWDRIKDDYPDYRFDFFGFPPNSATEFDQHVLVEDGRLVATTEKLRNGFAMTSGGHTAIVGADYSAFVTLGLGISGPQRARQIFANYRTTDLAEPGLHLISDALLGAYVKRLCSMPHALRPFEALRAVSDAPIFLHATLTPMSEILTAEKHRGEVHTIPDVYRRLTPIFDRICKEVGQPDLYRYIPQPPETLEPSGLTRPEFVRSGSGFAAFSGKLSKKQQDYFHGNADYGVVAVRRLILEFERSGLRAFEPA